MRIRATEQDQTTEDNRVGARVHALRDAMGLSLRDLAERSGVSAPMLSQVERGETSPTIAVAAKIAAGLDLTLSQLLRLDEGEHVVVSRGQGLRRCPASARMYRCTRWRPAPRPAARRTRRCTSLAAARLRSSSAGPSPWSSTAAATSLARATRSPSTPIFPTISRTKATMTRGSWP
jgi:transcriptional regulator with XRE-family HTH domain